MELTTLPLKFGEWIFILLSAVIIILANLSLSLSLMKDYLSWFQKILSEGSLEVDLEISRVQ